MRVGMHKDTSINLYSESTNTYTHLDPGFIRVILGLADLTRKLATAVQVHQPLVAVGQART